MTDKLLAYLLDDLSPVEREEVARRLATDPAWQAEFERLQTCLGPEEGAEGDSSDTCDIAASSPPPPRDLVQRTCCLVQRFCPRHEERVPAGMSATDCAWAWSPSRWSGPDLIVASVICLVLGSFAMPMLCRQREQARRQTCQDNLFFLGTRLADYAQIHGQLPPIRLGDNAGRYVMRLAAEGGVDREQLAQHTLCPSAQSKLATAGPWPPNRIPTAAQLASASPPLQAKYLTSMGGNYAARVGAFDAWGNYREVRYTGSRFEPMLADEPNLETPGIRSLNHGDNGQFVLYQDVSVRYVNDCQTPCGIPTGCSLSTHDPAKRPEATATQAAVPAFDHFFLNLKSQPAGGLGLRDIVMLKSEYGPTGLIRVTNQR